MKKKKNTAKSDYNLMQLIKLTKISPINANTEVPDSSFVKETYYQVQFKPYSKIFWDKIYSGSETDVITIY